MNESKSKKTWRRRGRKGEPQPQAWTKKARDDIYARRQAGEHWETICLDYPERTRAAMQQQYSAMKRIRDAASVQSSESTFESDSDSETENGVEIDREVLTVHDSHMADGDALEGSARPTPSKSPGLAPQASYTQGKPIREVPLKRKAECTQPESCSPAKRGGHFASGQSEAYSFRSSEPVAGLKGLDSQAAAPGLLFSPEDIAKGIENFNNLSTAFNKEKAAQKEAFEAGLRRATRRANEAENRLRDVTQHYAAQTKAEAEANAEKLRKELANAKPDHPSEDLKTALKAFSSEHSSAMTKCEAVQIRSDDVRKSIAKFIEDMDEMTIKEIKSTAIGIEKEIHSVLDQAVMELVKAGKVVEGFQKVFADASKPREPAAGKSEHEATKDDEI